MSCAVCLTPSSKVCAKCHVTYYCSTEHQQQDWKTNHKDSCIEYPHQTGASRACATMFAWYKDVMSLPQTTFEQKKILILELMSLLMVATTSDYLKTIHRIQWALVFRIVDLAIELKLNKKRFEIMLHQIPSSFNARIHTRMRNQLALLHDDTNVLTIPYVRQIRALDTLHKASRYFSNDLIQIVVDEKMNGLDVIASRDIQKGDIIINEPPFLSSSLDMYGMCYYCGRLFETNSPTTCRKNCGFRYCDAQCETSAFSRYHSPLCSAAGFKELQKILLATAKEDPESIGALQYTLLLIKFCGMQIVSNQNVPLWQQEPLCYFISADDINDCIKTRDSMTFYSIFTQLVFAISTENTEFERPPMINTAWFFQMTQYLWSNVFGHGYNQLTFPLDLNGLSSGIAFEHTATLFNHSCVPNIVGIMEHVTIKYVAVQHIVKGESLRISYLKSPTKDSLHNKYNFDCDCARCKTSKKHRKNQQIDAN